MLLCPDSEGYLCITQPAHAWVAGQLARSWGNASFGFVTPREDVCLAAEQHDIGWLPWEAHPSLNPQTGYPYHFTDLPTPEHVHIWSGTRSFSQSFGRYVSLLVSLHGTGIYERHTGWQHSAMVRPLVEAFLADEKQFQRQTVAQLQQGSNRTEFISESILERNRALIASWDWLSILLCIGFDQDQQVSGVPTATTPAVLTLRPLSGGRSRQAQISPWPFQHQSVTIRVEGRLLSEPLTDKTELEQAFAVAPGIVLEMLLTAA